MTDYTAFLYVDAETGTTHLLAWEPDIHEWLVPCGNIERSPRERVTYKPTEPLCLSCINLTQSVTRTAPRTRNR